MPAERPDPEKLLQRVQEEEKAALQGKLKIYLGAAPGVGKTYTMLQDAIEKLAQGLDIVIGVVESHGRKEIESLLNHFEILPLKKVEYRGKELHEFDLDAALQRQAGLILIDEMAHTNIPGLRHQKRWQDIKELLDCGLDVTTTLNVQHIESLNDIIEQITGIAVKETIPNSMLEIAHTIELVDLPPEDLLKRLQEGKVYYARQAELAQESFFRKGNLIALRELALRITAERVGTQVLHYRHDQGIKRIWPTKEKILVCVGHHAGSARLIRAAKRMAANLQAEWFAVHIDSPQLNPSKEKRAVTIQHLSLAERLGAQSLILSGFDIVNEIMNFAHEKNITQIIVGKEIRSRWRNLFFRSLPDEIVRHSGEIDVYIMTSDINRNKYKKKDKKSLTTPWKTYLFSITVMAIITGISLLVQSYINHANLIMLYLLGSVIVALFGEIGPSTLASLLSVTVYGLFFVSHPFTIQQPIILAVMLLLSQFIGYLTVFTRRQVDASRLAQQRLGTLYTLSHQLASIRGVNKLVESATDYLTDIFESEPLILIVNDNNKLVIQGKNSLKQALSEQEQAVAQWVYDMGQRAGLGADTLSSSDALYLPLIASEGTIGVLRIKPLVEKSILSPDQIHLLEACANQIALAIDVDRLQDKRKNTELARERRRARNTLLQSVSHDLRVSLVILMGTASSLMHNEKKTASTNIAKLADRIYLESEQLGHLISNLLQLTHFETETPELKKEWHSLKDIIIIVIDISRKKIGKKEINLSIKDGLPNVFVDVGMIREVLLNLLDNAIKFSPIETPVLISSYLEGGFLLVSIEDQGIGVVPEEINKLFEKFYRGQMITTQRGVGLGLSICRMIIEAHAGKIWAENKGNGGAIFYFSLPL
ncbi:MAG: sensor histidine kinase KdpD [Legionellales bacterium]|nr:sensor histidine kinase KdpD [Legionellales bacterium]